MIEVDGNRARQLLRPAGSASLDISASPPRLIDSDDEAIHLVAGKSGLDEGERGLKVGRDGLKNPLAVLGEAKARWIGDLSSSSPAEIRESWPNSFDFVLEDPDAARPGLRLPQLGAVHGVLGFWTTGSTHPATVVMPTGTGKTETMVGLLVSAQPNRLLVVVPSDILRTQIAEKFESLGVLRLSVSLQRRAKLLGSEVVVILPDAVEPPGWPIRWASEHPGLVGPLRIESSRLNIRLGELDRSRISEMPGVPDLNGLYLLRLGPRR